MSRITAPATKLARTIGSNASSVSRPSNLLSNGSKSAITTSRSADIRDHNESSDHHQTTSRTLTTLTPSHRPVHQRRGVVPLMQTFRTTSAAPAAEATYPRPVDFAVLPSRESLWHSSPSSDAIRVPLLPDNFTPDRSSPVMATETLDGPLTMPEIHVVAATPENVVSAVSEVEGMDPHGVELGFVHGLDMVKEKVAEEGGMIRDLWKGLMDDVFGDEGKKVKAG